MALQGGRKVCGGDKSRLISLSGSEAMVGACCFGEMFGRAESAGGVLSVAR